MLSTVAEPFHIPSAMYVGSDFSTSSTPLDFFSNFGQSRWYRVVSHCGFVFIFLMTNELNIFSCASCLFVSLLCVETSMHAFDNFFKIWSFLVVELKVSLQIRRLSSD